jgi:hypothetical protein
MFPAGDRTSGLQGGTTRLASPRALLHRRLANEGGVVMPTHEGTIAEWCCGGISRESVRRKIDGEHEASRRRSFCRTVLV